jgi:glycosyltransferase involved in cell wall biosynthesis
VTFFTDSMETWSIVWPRSWHDDFLGGIIPGLTRLEEQNAEQKKQRHEKEVQARLEHERYKRKLRDPYWARRVTFALVSEQRKSMKLVVIITGTGVGGAETMLHKVLTRLSPEFKPQVISMIPVGRLGEKLHGLGIPVESVDMRSGIPNPGALIRLIRDLRRLKPDLVHTWMYHADLMGGVAARLARVPALAWCIHHSNLALADNKIQTVAVVRVNAFLSHRVPDRILCCSEAARNIHVASGYAPEKMVVIPNGFDLEHFKPDPNARLSVRAELGVPFDTALVGLIGRWNPQKNHAGFLSATATLHLRRPEVHFLLAGQGVDAGNQTIQRTLAATGLAPVTHLLGLRDDIPRLMAALDVLASSSYGEAFPNVIGEAMACGVPCVVTDVGDSALIVGETGQVIKSGDMAGLAVAIDLLLTPPPDERRALGERARARVVEHFEIGNIVRQYEAFYEEVASVGRQKRRWRR